MKKVKIVFDLLIAMMLVMIVMVGGIATTKFLLPYIVGTELPALITYIIGIVVGILALVGWIYDPLEFEMTEKTNSFYDKNK